MLFHSVTQRIGEHNRFIIVEKLCKLLTALNFECPASDLLLFFACGEFKNFFACSICLGLQVLQLSWRHHNCSVISAALVQTSVDVLMMFKFSITSCGFLFCFESTDGEGGSRTNSIGWRWRMSVGKNISTFQSISHESQQTQ